MSNLLDDPVYPFDQTIARELHLALCVLYPTGKAAMFAAEKAGLQPHMLDGAQPAYLVWKEILAYAAGAQLMRSLVNIAVQDFPRSPRRQFFETLLEGKTPPVNHEATTKFLKKTDAITEPEALLFHDDLTLPVGRISRLISALEKMRLLAPAVCKLEVATDGKRGLGTAFRISDRWLLTNEHVLHLEGAAPRAITAIFGYDDDGNGGGSAGVAVPCDPNSVMADTADDWGVVRTLEPLESSIPIINLLATAVPESDGAAFVIQHPGGDRKRVAYARNQIVYFDDEVLHYLSDTATGSSGAPVFDDQGRIIGLHRAGGAPQEVAGQAPVRKNEGVRIDRVSLRIRAAGIVLD